MIHQPYKLDVFSIKDMEQKDKTRIKIKDLLQSHPDGLTIADLMRKTGLARHTVLARLHTFIGQGHVNVRKINMAKLHYWNAQTDEPKEKKEEKPIELKPLKEEHITHNREKSKPEEPFIDMAKIKEEIGKELQKGTVNQEQAQVKEQRAHVSHTVNRSKHKTGRKEDEFIKTEVPGFDQLFDQGIPKGSAVLVAGGAGSGKTLLLLEILKNHASKGHKCLYMSFEESEDRLIHHMEDFGWNVRDLIKKGNLLIKKFNPFEITRSVDALLMKAKGELLIDIEPIIFPKDFKPDIIVVDSLTAIASAFTDKEDSYRIYIEQLFTFFQGIDATSFLITETKQIPTVFSQTGVEEFLADGVIVLYNIRKGNIRENAIEVLKLRGANHQKKIVAMQITNEGIIVYPEQEVFGGIDDGENK
tara:strand:- start:71 stop:1318 length:1248 start_codon:yes stop_codon:yes gene_type:complete